MGHAATSLHFFKVVPSKERGGGDAAGDAAETTQQGAAAAASTPTAEGGAQPPLTLQLLGGQVDETLGVYDAVSLLAEEVVAQPRLLSAAKLSPLRPKDGQLLRRAAARCVKDLSCLPHSAVEIEGFSSNDVDVTHAVTREHFETLCSPLQEKLSTLITSAIDAASASLGCDIRELSSCPAQPLSGSASDCSSPPSSAPPPPPPSSSSSPDGAVEVDMEAAAAAAAAADSPPPPPPPPPPAQEPEGSRAAPFRIPRTRPRLSRFRSSHLEEESAADRGPLFIIHIL
eukprot:GHVU01210753.1.p1 GENE.GHVU01210753.1~~GHVU01210753.1.p1  ORF type:complete len:327 (-),score=93.49 GHVU01210753.1:41-898(-)